MICNLHTEHYDGPFDILLDLLQKDKINICDISIVDITNQYIATIEEMQKRLDMETMTDFLDMAVKLLEIKSRYLLYLQREQEEEDPTQEIRKSLEIYKAYRNAAIYLRERTVDRENYYTRKPGEVYIDEYLNLEAVSLEGLLQCASVVFEKKNENPVMISYKTKSVEDRINEIKQVIQEKKKFSFCEILDTRQPDDYVVTLLSVLEMSRFKEVKSVQKKTFGDIIIERLDVPYES